MQYKGIDIYIVDGESLAMITLLYVWYSMMPVLYTTHCQGTIMKIPSLNRYSTVSIIPSRTGINTAMTKVLTPPVKDRICPSDEVIVSIQYHKPQRPTDQHTLYNCPFY